MLAISRAWSFVVLVGLGGALASGLAACADDATGPASGTLSIGPDEGLDLVAGRLRSPGNFANSDLYAAANGDQGLELLTGGPNATKNRPVVWFKGGGGLPTTFASFDEVPGTLPDASSTAPMLHAKAHYGFVLQTRTGTYIKGWLEAANGTSVTVRFGPANPAE